MAAKRSMPALWLEVTAGCFALVVGAASARAATPVYVDGAGGCAGLSPCFMTIQDGINQAGPAPAVVNVFPGSYAESVDLSLMGSAIAGSPGDLVLRTVNGAGVPSPGTASIVPAAGIAVRNSVSPFPGDVTIDGFSLRSGNARGINLDMQGDLMLTEVVSDGNGTDGMNVQIQGDVTIVDSSFSDNTNGFGMSFGTATDVTLERVSADGNDNFNASFSLTGEVSIIDSSFTNSTSNFGLSFSTATNVILDRVVANGNDNFNASFSLTGEASIVDSTFNDSTNNFGLSFSTATDATLERVTANGNHNFNASFSLTGEVSIVDSTFNDSTDNFGLSFSTATDATLERVTANGNSNSNASFSLKGVLRIMDSTFSNSTGNFGLSFSTPTDVFLDRVTADGNRNFNASFSVAESVRITNSSFSRSATNNGLSFSSPVRALLAGVVAEGNALTGVAVTAENADITGSRFVGNQTGVRLAPLEVDGDFRLRCNDIAENRTSGLVVSAPASVNAEQNYWGAPSGPTHPSNPGGTGDSIVDGANGGAGTVDFQPFLTMSAAESPICQPESAPAADGVGLAVLLLALFVLPAWRLSRRSPA